MGTWITIILLIIYSWVSTLISLNKLEVQRISKIKRQQVGSYYNERLNIVNCSVFQKSWIAITNPFENIYISKSRVICDIGKKTTRTLNSQIYLKKRGVFNIGPVFIQSGDPFGFFIIQKELLIPKENLIVYPHFEKIKNIGFFPGKEFGGSNLRKQTPVTTPQAAGIREYLPGDPLNRVHWQKSARMNKLMVKEFDEDTQSNVWIFLDAQDGPHRQILDDSKFGMEDHISFFSRKMHYQLPKDSFEYAISIAASIAHFYIIKNKSVGLVCNSNQTLIVFPDKGRNHFRKIIDSLTLVEDNGNLPINRMLEKQSKNISIGSSIVLITPTNPVDIRKETESIKSRGINLLMIHINEDSFHEENNKSKQKTDGDNILREIISVNYGDNIQNLFERK